MLTPLSAGKHLRLQRVAGTDGSVYKLEGVIDETVDRSQLLDGSSQINVFDLDGVNRITSYGVREWMNAIRGLPPSSYTCFVNCRPSIVSQFNMVAGFAGGGQLVTFYAPYLCTQCEKYSEHLIDVRKTYAQLVTFQVPSIACDACGGEAEFDDVPETYLAFVASSPPPTPPPRASALIDGDVQSSAPQPFRIQKEIVESTTLLWLSGEMERGGHFKRLADGLEGKVLLIAGNISSAKEAGVHGLTTFLQKPELDLFMARAPLWLARLLGATHGFGGARLLSLQLPFQCQTHGVFDAEIAATQLRQIPGTFKPPLCPLCQKAGALKATPEELEEVRQLPLASAPPELTELLKARPSGPLQALDDGSGPRAAPWNPDAGPQTFGRYELIKRIGLGGMAEVFLARQLGPMGFEKRVVLKRILPQYSSQPAFIEMFLEEARLAARVSHSNVVQVFDLGQVGNQYFIAMEYVPGKDLALLLRVCRQLGMQVPLEVACRLVMGICAGLQAAHAATDDRGNPLVIVHRDVSPHNVLVSTDGTVKVTDFGVAKLANAVGKTEPGVIKGKINYMAPELFLDSMPIDGRVDVFAAGVILYQLLTQTLPFGRNTDAATMRAILEEQAPEPSKLRTDAPPELDRIVAQALAKSVNARYPTASALQQALEGCVARLGQHSSSAILPEWIQDMTERLTAMDLGVNPLSQLLAFTPSARSDDDVTRSFSSSPGLDQTKEMSGNEPE